ncbi:hypothetical protein GCM10009865_41780 [Aeromicrobium ponti]|uniref:Membrane transport protein MMPL domain-containing protein n=1 Tax=Cytobacillus oceanisediminis TaxID=665099 RepID=A0A562JJ00_9BACI|nr:MMPL family transporter [Cytobacillus oceanisediminis]TWH83023.1 hypothetical protein IQ19_04005 [Cytobacillus oceanisediminis]
MKILIKLAGILEKYPMKAILLSIAAIIVTGVGAQNIEMATGNDTLVSRESRVYQENEQLEKEFGGESVIVMYEARRDNLLAVQNLNHMKRLENELLAENDIYSILSPVTLVEQMVDKKFQTYQDGIKEISGSLEKVGGNLSSISRKLDLMSANADVLQPGLPEKQETLENMVYDDEGQLRSLFEEVVVDERHMMMIIKFEGGAPDSSKSEIVEKINSFLDENKVESADVFVSGKPVLDDAIRASMKESMQKMMMLSVVFMIIILSLVFKVGWRILPLGIILAAVIGTVGLMGWISIPITMVSMAVFPILIGLGIDYAIQFQSRYSEEMSAEEAQNE